MKKKIGIIVLIIISIMLIVGIAYNVYAKYVLSKKVSISFDTSDYYFDVEIDKTEITILPATISVTVKNYEGENFTDTDIEYYLEISDDYIITSGADTKILKGGKKSKETFSIIIDKENQKQGGEIELKVNVEKPYTDEVSKSIVYKTIYDIEEGAYIKYDSGENGIIDMRVLYPATSNYGLQIISNESVKNITLGGNSWEEGRESYNNAIETLNNEAMKYLNTTYGTDARCIGSNPVDKNSETKETVILSKEIWSGYVRPNSWINDDTGCKGEDDNYITDVNAMKNANIMSIKDSYWLASRFEYHSDIFYGFYINMYYAETGLIGNGTCCGLDNTPRIAGYSYTFGFRPVISLKDTLKIESGNGTKENPYILTE